MNKELQILEDGETVLIKDTEKPKPKKVDKWTDEEAERLKKYVEQYGPKWKKIAAKLGDKDRNQVRNKWVNCLDPNLKRGEWTEEEDQKLLEAHAKYYYSWSKIAESIPGRTDESCRKRWQSALNPSILKGEWTPEEDQILIKAHEKQMEINPDELNWTVMSMLIPGRTAKQCRARWKLSLDPDLKTGNWSPEEDQLLIKAFDEHGKNWSKISEYLPGRTDVQVRMRWVCTLDPDNKLGHWSKEEDDKLIKAYDQFGDDWQKVSEFIPNRKPAQCKVRQKQLNTEIYKTWTINEDKELIKAWKKIGNKWVEVAKVMESRTDDQVKARFKTLNGMFDTGKFDKNEKYWQLDSKLQKYADFMHQFFSKTGLRKREVKAESK